MREKPAAHRFDQGRLLLGVAFSADSGNQYPEDRNAAFLAVVDHSLVYAGQDFPVPFLKGTLVLVGAAEACCAGF